MKKAGVLTGFVAACSKGGGTRKEICEKDHTGSHRDEAQGSLCEIGGRDTLRSVMVPQVSRQVEWSEYPPNPKYGSGPPWLRCIGFMGLCSNLEQLVAPMAMEQLGTGVADCSKGTPTDCSSNSGLGQRV